MMQNIIDVAERAARKAGKYALSRADSLKEVEYKGAVNNLVTDVDKACEKMIIDEVSSAFPAHSILAEEGGEGGDDSESLWIIDPLDGTTNYAHGFPFYAVSIAYVHKGEVLAGVAYIPSRDEMFTAVKGKGACLNGDPMRVSSVPDLEHSLIATGFAYSKQGKGESVKYFGRILEKAQAVRRPGAAVLDLCYVACGRFDGFWEMGLNPWDVAAGQLMIKEAGGKVTMMEGQELDIYGKNIVATNGVIHEELLNALKNSD